YWAISYGSPHVSIATLPGMQDRTILLDGCSKTFAMTGWRLGFAALPAELVEPVTRLIINSVSCTSAFSQRAMLAALGGPWEPVGGNRTLAAVAARRRLRVMSDPAKPPVLVTRRLPDIAMAAIAERCEVTLHEGDDAMPRDELVKAVGGKRGAVTLLTDRIDD